MNQQSRLFARWNPALARRPVLLKSGSGRSERSSRVRENLEYLIKAQVLENVTNGSLQSSKQEFPVVTFHSLHRCNQRCQTGAIDVSHARKIDHQTLRLVVDHGHKSAPTNAGQCEHQPTAH